MSLKRRDIIDTAETWALLMDAISEGERTEIIGILRAAHDRGCDVIRSAFMNGHIRGQRQSAAQAYLMDQILSLLYGITVGHIFPLGNPTEAERLSLVALGGYGREELSPHSDVDLVFLSPYKRTGWCEQVTEYMLYVLWDLGISLGYSVHSPGEMVRKAQTDLSTRTALLEVRAITGDGVLAQALIESFQTDVVAGSGPDFLEQKLAERDKRHKRFGDSRYVVEPDLKDGKGGLRDLHTLYWIIKHLYGVDRRRDMSQAGLLRSDELQDFRRAYRFFLHIRAHLHYLTGRAEDRLTFDVQPALADLLDYHDRGGLSPVERFMKHYFSQAKRVGDLTRVVCAALEEREQKRPLFSRTLWPFTRQVDDFRIDRNRLNFRPEEDLAAHPHRMVTIFAAAQKSGLDIHPEAFRSIKPHLKHITAAVRRDKRATQAFLEVLTAKDHPETNLTRMNEAGVLGRFVPDFGKIVAMMQFDMYHHYTVDAHTIRAIGLLAAIERGEMADDHPYATRILQNLASSRRALYLAVLCHDIAKGRNGDHSILGEQVALKLCKRLGLAEAEVQMVAWLVRYHLLMSHYAFKRDQADPQTLEEFVTQVAGLERLKLLLVLTVVDIKAVGPDTWNNWKAQLLRDLYQAAEERLRAGHAHTARVERVRRRKQAVEQHLADITDEAVPRFLDSFPDSYWIAEEEDTIAANGRMAMPVLQTPEVTVCACRIDPVPKQDLARASVLVRDRPGLFADLAGAFAASGAMVVDAKLHTSAEGWALDNFVVQTLEGQAFDHPRRLAALKEALTAAAQGRHEPQHDIEKRGHGGKRQRRARMFQVIPAVFVDNGVSARSTVIEVNARDRSGLLYDLALALTAMKVTVVSAHITTFGERAVDTFYLVSDADTKILDLGLLKNLEAALLAAAEGKILTKAA